MKLAQKKIKSQVHPLFDVSTNAGVGGQLAGNIRVTITAQGFRFLLQLGSTIVMARLLSPGDFGLIAMVAVLINFIAVIKDAGLVQATIQHNTISEEQISALFWINAMVSILLGVVAAALGPFIAWVYGDDRLVLVAIALSLPIMISGLRLQHRALLQRNFKFVDMALIDIFAQILGTLAGILSALAGLGFWSLVVMQVVASLVNLILLWTKAAWLPQRVVVLKGVGGMLKFGADISGANILNYLARNSDNFLVGKFIGVDALGFYDRAYSLIMTPIRQLNAPIVSALMPTLSRLQDEPVEFEKAFLKLSKFVVWVTAIPIALLSGFGEMVIVYLLGEAWRSSGQIFEWLAVAAIFQPVTNLTGTVFVSLGRTREMLRWSAFSSVCIVISFLIGVQYGVEGIAFCYAIAVNMILPILPFYAFRETHIAVASYFKAIQFPVIISIAIVIAFRILHI
ncbi:MAG: lipopolysaccharide biosynthesis protein [Haliea sp.]|nr:lipopolysaccharide biosynthesis protein [Haliea sp.]